MPKSLKPLDALWQPPVIVWTVLAGEGVAAILTLAAQPANGALTYFGLASLIVQWISMLALSGLYLLRRPLARLSSPWVACIALALLMLSAWLVSGAAWWLFHNSGGTISQDWQALGLRFAAIAFVVGVLGLAAFYNHWRLQQLALRAKQAELEALRARVHPHFLFNTLNTGATLVHQRPADAEQLLLDLADLFRAALTGPQAIPLGDELALARHYLEIEALRFGERLHIVWHLPETIPAAVIPTLSLQPLVENAIRHGIEPSPSGGEVAIAVAETAGQVEVSVRNPLPVAISPTAGHRIGQDAVGARIQTLTEGRGQLETGIVDGQYVATIRLPLP
ncbi:histidine kinase [Stenotrophomonas sp. MMGLT7]|uniref:sensor histidine kinase n=1 Tax=Stenotrophomonas sp. MMGLT7 TaxID=2901227 RepID=UPI001E3AF253|nr:histidine kinase [Stenotrophomonas sp. MMGLT7]MCD7098874.1 histidine kinase [Stenotrophomonas sp. MMGLT7]